MRNNIELPTGAPERKALDRATAKVEAIGRRIEETAAQHWPQDLSLARMMSNAGEHFENARYRMDGFVQPGPPRYPDPKDYVGFIMWLLGPGEFQALVRKRIEEMSPSPGMPPAEREAELTRLRAKERELLKEEEIETCRLEGDGYVVGRRRYPDVGILLEVWDSL